MGVSTSCFLLRLDSAADPLLWYNATNQSPESMAFVMLLEAAVAAYEARSF
jgi:hypothetical protein